MQETEKSPDIDISLSGELDIGQFQASKLATPWARLWSKMLDIGIAQLVVGLGLGLFAPSFVSQAAFSGPSGDRLLGFLTLPVSIALDACVQSLFGNTLGRVVVGIRVEGADHSKPNFYICLKRNFDIYVFGLAIGFPIVSIFTIWNCYSKLKNANLLHWDRIYSTRVFDYKGNIFRTSAAAFMYILVTLVPFAIAALLRVD
jgi:hypothetical protein